MDIVLITTEACFVGKTGGGYYCSDSSGHEYFVPFKDLFIHITSDDQNLFEYLKSEKFNTWQSIIDDLDSIGYDLRGKIQEYLKYWKEVNPDKLTMDIYYFYQYNPNIIKRM